MSSASFTDLSGVTWQFDLTIGCLERLARETGIDFLCAPAGLPGQFSQLVESPTTLASAVYHLLQPEITPQEFAGRINGDVLAAMESAVSEGVANFFAQWRPTWAAAFRTLTRSMLLQTNRDGLTAATIIEEAFLQFGNLSGGPQESLE